MADFYRRIFSFILSILMLIFPGLAETPEEKEAEKFVPAAVDMTVNLVFGDAGQTQVTVEANDLYVQKAGDFWYAAAKIDNNRLAELLKEVNPEYTLATDKFAPVIAKYVDGMWEIGDINVEVEPPYVEPPKEVKFRYSCDCNPAGTYYYDSDTLLHIFGWAFDENGQYTDCCYRFDDGEETALAKRNRTDVQNAFPTCSQTDCGFDDYVPVKGLSMGSHTMYISVRCGEKLQVMKSFSISIINKNASIRANSDSILSGSYNLGGTPGVWINGWAYNSSAEDVRVYYSFDGGEKYLCGTNTRKDVVNAFGDCYNEQCGYRQLVQIGNLTEGEHTITVTAVSGNLTKEIKSSVFSVVYPECSVTFNPNGGSGSIQTVGKTYRINLPIPETVPTREGFIFKCWNTKSDGTGESYLPGEYYNHNNQATLYAQWKTKVFDRYDTDFEIPAVSGAGIIGLNGTAVAAGIERTAKQITYTVNRECERFNYYGFSYRSSGYVRGVITYASGSGTVSEEFFLEPSGGSTFLSFIDDCMNDAYGTKIISVSFTALNSDSLDMSLNGMGVFSREAPQRTVYISNDYLKIGVDMLWGGALSYYEDLNPALESVVSGGRVRVDYNASGRYGADALGNHINLINRHDAGRLVQQSYYGTMNYECGYFNGHYVAYNPVQGGNQFNDSSKIVDIRTTENSIYVKCRPLDWAKEKEYITDCYMEATYTLSGSVMKAECRAVDYSGYDPETRNQELPAFYGIEPMDNFVYYSGSTPWTGDKALSAVNGLDSYAYAQYPSFKNKECWGIFRGEFEDSFGIGVYIPGTETIIAGLYRGDGNATENPDISDPTTYISGAGVMTFRSFSPITYDFYLSSGTTDQIRESFSKLPR